MARAANKIQQTQASVEAFLAAIEPEARQTDARAICTRMAKVYPAR